MTLVVGLNLGDSVAVVADSRVTVRYEDGRTSLWDNALKVYACPPFFIVGVAGDAFAGTCFFTSLWIRLNELWKRDEEVFRRFTDLDWMRREMIQTCEANLGKGLLQETQTLACVIAIEDRATIDDLGERPGTVTPPPSATDATFETSARLLAHNPEVGEKLRSLFSIRFPGIEICETEPGKAVHVGSGSRAAKRLSEVATVMIPPPDMSHGDRLAAAAWDIARAQQLSGDPSFNGIYFGMSLSCGIPEMTLHSFQDWPAGGASKDEYEWENYHFRDVLRIGYSAGLDVAELNKGWIYDGDARKRTRLQSFLEPEFIDAQVRQEVKLCQWIL